MPVFRSPICASSEDAERCLHLSLKQDHVPVFHSPSWASSEDAERDYDGSSLSLTSAPTKSLHVDSDDDDSEGIEESEAVSTAQYVKGIVGMARGVLKHIPAIKKMYRHGVFLIDISDGGSILFYSRSILTDAPGDEIKAGTDRGTGVSVCASISSFVEPHEEPYLRIPADVPWKFQVVGSNSFQIVVPPRNGHVDYRVELKKPSYLFKKKRIAKHSNGTMITSQHYDDSDSTKTKCQLFIFRCKLKGEVAVYAKAAQNLGRNDSGNNMGGLMFSNSNVRTRTAKGIEIASQSALIGRSNSVKHFKTRRDSSLGEAEHRCFPLYCFPNTWMTKSDLVAELPRKSKKFHDLRRNASRTTGKAPPDEIGNLKIEVLQCIGLPKMDTASLSDAYCFVVCGSNSFVTDVIPDNCNPCWLPPTRRACILPIHNAYSQVYVGVFDYDGEKTSDDFIGRVVVDIPQLPSGRTLSVTLPLRENSRVYNENRLGSIRLRLQLNWTNGERAALLSYFPRSLPDIKKRMKSPKDPVTVVCPDAKSFHNVALTVYGKDMPGRYSNDMKDAVSKEVALIRIFLVKTSKRKIVDVIRWRNPVTSLYFFYGWMRFVITTSGTFLAMYILSLFFIFMLRNYLKYNINSPASRLLGHRTIGGMTRALLVNRSGSQGSPLHGNRGISHFIKRLVHRMAGIPKNTPDSWKCGDHAEFPFSTGSVYTKVSSDEAAARPVWEAAVATEDHSDYSSDESSHSSDLSDIVDDIIDDDRKNALAKMRLPNQNVAHTSERKSLGTEIKKIHYKVQRANFHLFDDRVFIAEDRTEAKKQLKFNTTKNPIQKMINPWMASMLKILEYELSAFRAMFNIMFWKDPMLSYWAMVFLCCLMILVLIFPWRRFFFVVGILLLGPQNYYMNIIDWHRSKMAKKKGELRQSLLLSKSARNLNAYHDNEYGSGQIVCDPPQSFTRNDDLLSNSPLLLRNNTQLKPDGKLRKVIVPSVPFRYNRFYDWPPDPDSTIIR